MSRVSLRPALLQTALQRPTTQLLPRCAAITATAPGTARTFSHLPALRPTLFNSPTSVFRPPTTTTTQLFAPATPTASSTCGAAAAAAADLVPKSAISAHPAFAGAAAQIRCGPRATMSGASRLVQKRRHGFVSRMKTIGGRKMLARRRIKGRRKLGH